MTDTKQTLEAVGISRQWLYVLMRLHKIKPQQKIVKGKIKNFFTANQVRTLKCSIADKETVEA